ncbi:MAG: DUF5615 family PIN-like protein [Actinomycetota bacterium]|nr:DUF5615 family PIN-like protein [Actinomycetota bacterium]MDP9485730.1 DUF5615 family PIN-like protein [Actinomycetota bacterium]
MLLDENVDNRLKRSFPQGHEVVTVAETGWSGKKNGELLRLAEKEFDAFVTTDKGLERTSRTSRSSISSWRCCAR